MAGVWIGRIGFKRESLIEIPEKDAWINFASVRYDDEKDSISVLFNAARVGMFQGFVYDNVQAPMIDGDIVQTQCKPGGEPLYQRIGHIHTKEEDDGRVKMWGEIFCAPLDKDGKIIPTKLYGIWCNVFIPDHGKGHEIPDRVERVAPEETPVYNHDDHISESVEEDEDPIDDDDLPF